LEEVVKEAVKTLHEVSKMLVDTRSRLTKARMDVRSTRVQEEIDIAINNLNIAINNITDMVVKLWKIVTPTTTNPNPIDDTIVEKLLEILRKYRNVKWIP